MPARKMRVELFDSEGNKYSVAFEGQMTREKALRVLDLVELLGGSVNPETNSIMPTSRLSKYGKVHALVQKAFPIVWFSSKEVQAAYEEELKEPISLSTVATYFARMANKGLLMKAGTPNRLKYKLVQSVPQTVIKQKKS